MNGMRTVLGGVRPGMARHLGPQRKGTECVMGTVLGQSTACSGTALCSPGFIDELKLSMCFTSTLLLELNNMC